MEVGGCHGGERTTHLQRREGDGFLSSTSNTTPTCVCACDCVLGARAVVAQGVRRQLCLLPWDLWGVDWSGGSPGQGRALHMLPPMLEPGVREMNHRGQETREWE